MVVNNVTLCTTHDNRVSSFLFILFVLIIGNGFNIFTSNPPHRRELIVSGPCVRVVMCVRVRVCIALI